MYCLPEYNQLRHWDSLMFKLTNNFFLAIWKKQVWSDSDGLCKSQEKRKEQEVLPPLMKVWKYESMLLGNERQDVILNSPPSWADSAATQRPWRNIADKKKKKAQFQTIPSKVFPVFDGHEWIFLRQQRFLSQICPLLEIKSAGQNFSFQM